MDFDDFRYMKDTQTIITIYDGSDVANVVIDGKRQQTSESEVSRKNKF